MKFKIEFTCAKTICTPFILVSLEHDFTVIVAFLCFAFTIERQKL